MANAAPPGMPTSLDQLELELKDVVPGGLEAGAGSNVGGGIAAVGQEALGSHNVEGVAVGAVYLEIPPAAARIDRSVFRMALVDAGEAAGEVAVHVGVVGKVAVFGDDVYYAAHSAAAVEGSGEVGGSLDTVAVHEGDEAVLAESAHVDVGGPDAVAADGQTGLVLEHVGHGKRGALLDVERSDDVEDSGSLVDESLDLQTGYDSPFQGKGVA